MSKVKPCATSFTSDSQHLYSANLNGGTVENSDSVVAAGRLHSLDGLRAVAASLVVLHHLGASGFGASLVARGHGVLGFVIGTIGTSGVELFFVLSAVVLARPYLRGSRPMDVASYFRRRVVRLYPPYLFAWLLAGLGTYLTSAYPSPFSTTATLATFSVGSWLSQLGIIYFGAHYSWAWWSLTVECLFYLLIPLLIPLLLRVPRGTVASLALLVAAVALALTVQQGNETTAPVAEHLKRLIVYAPCFVAGLVMSREDLPKSAAPVLVLVGFAFLVTSYEVPRVTGHIGYGLIQAGIVSRALDPMSRLSRALGRWHLVWLGERSYSLFLTHCTIIVLVLHGASMLTSSRGLLWLVLTRGIAVPIALLVAMALFSGVERKFAHGLVTANSFWPWRAGSRRTSSREAEGTSEEQPHSLS
jgi:peptidoglycan/LPS O-acetylase OafA/YrhL